MVAKAEEDTDFRVRLFDNPRSALKEAFDIELPDDFNVMVHEENARTAQLVLAPSSELTVAQLEQVAGGQCNASVFWGSD